MGMVTVVQKGRRQVVTDTFGRPFLDVPVAERRRCITGHHLRHVIEGIVRGITAKEIKHYYGGSGAATTPDLMLLPRLPQNWLFTVREQYVILGYTVHEICHQLYTTFGIMDRIFPGRNDKDFKPTKRQKHVKAFWNAIEDYRIEKICRNAHPGFPNYIDVTRDHSARKFLERVANGEYTPKNLSNPFFLGAVAITWHAAPLNRYRTQAPTLALAAVNPKLRAWVESWTDDLAQVTIASDALDLAERMVDDLYAQMEQEKDESADDSSESDPSLQQTPEIPPQKGSDPDEQSEEDSPSDTTDAAGDQGDTQDASDEGVDDASDQEAESQDGDDVQDGDAEGAGTDAADDEAGTDAGPQDDAGTENGDAGEGVDADQSDDDAGDMTGDDASDEESESQNGADAEDGNTDERTDEAADSAEIDDGGEGDADGQGEADANGGSSEDATEGGSDDEGLEGDPSLGDAGEAESGDDMSSDQVGPEDVDGGDAAGTSGSDGEGEDEESGDDSTSNVVQDVDDPAAGNDPDDRSGDDDGSDGKQQTTSGQEPAGNDDEGDGSATRSEADSDDETQSGGRGAGDGSFSPNDEEDLSQRDLDLDDSDEDDERQKPRPKLDIDEDDDEDEPQASDLDIDEIRNQFEKIDDPEAEDATTTAPENIGQEDDRPDETDTQRKERRDKVAADGAQRFATLKASLGGAALRSAGIVRRMLQARNTTRIARGREEGDLDFERVVGMALGHSTIYRQMTRKIQVNTAISLLVDNSYSMKGHPLNVCQQAAIVLDQSVAGTKTAIEITGFTSRFFSSEVQLYQYRTFEQKGAASSSSLGNMTSVQLGGTPVAVPIYDAIRRLSCRPEERKLIIVVSDGAAEDPDEASDARAIAESMGFTVVGIAIGSDQNLDAMRQWCRIAHGIAKVDELPQALTRIVQEMLN